jgi:hypothetical protein
MINQEKSEFSDELITAAEKQIFEQSKKIEFYITEYKLRSHLI